MKFSTNRAMRLNHRAAGLGLMLLAAFASVGIGRPAAAAELAGVPESREIAFTVLRNGDAIGTHTLTFSEQDQALKVDIATDIKVELPLIGIAVYRFTHRGHETWRNGGIATLNSETDDDGTAHKLTVTQGAGNLRVNSDVGSHTSALDIVPASLWNPHLVQQSVLLNTLDGTEMPVTVELQGTETIQAHGTDVQSTHYRVSGGLNRDLWYNDAGELVRVQFAADDDSKIEYVLN